MRPDEDTKPRRGEDGPPDDPPRRGEDGPPDDPPRRGEDGPREGRIHRDDDPSRPLTPDANSIDPRVFEARKEK